MGRTPNFGDPATLAVLAAGLAPRRSLWRRARDAFRQDAKEFCLLTGLHGYKYIVQPGKHRSERLFWAVVVVVSMAVAVWMMVDAYEFSRTHPTILAVDTTHHPLWKVEAPGVTVCPGNKVLRSKAERLVRTMILPPNVTEEEVVADMGLFVELIAPRATNSTKFARLQSILDRNAMTVDSVMKFVSPSCDDLLVRCAWKRRMCLHCSDIFRQVRTAYGYCCSFNYIDTEFESYKPRMGGCVGVSYDKVQRLSACGYTNGLSVTVRVHRQEYFSSFLASHAVMILIHNPVQWPDGNADIKVVNAGTVSFISYMAQVSESSKRLRTGLPASVRKCQFMEETFLPRFGSYTFENCMASCQANRTITTCGCIPITYPNGLQQKVCDLMDTPCVTAVTSDPSHEHQMTNASMCPMCQPLCENVEYKVETSVGVLDRDELPDGDMLIQGLGGDQEDYALFHVFPGDLVTTRYLMNMYMTREELLGSLGGLSGLFVGFSLVSGFEFVYFFTIRPFFRMRARQQSASLAASRGPSTSPMGGLGGLGATGGPSRGPAPFPLAGPHVFRLRRRGGDGNDTRLEGDERRDRSHRRDTGRVSMIPVIE